MRCHGLTCIDVRLTLHPDTVRMPDSKHPDLPLASYVLRVRGQPATLRYELHNLRTGDRRVFLKAERLAAFLREQGLDSLDSAAPLSPRATP